MKKLLKKTLILAMLVMLVISLASCDQLKSILGKDEPADDNQNVVNDTWNMSTVYAKAQSLGYEGTLDEFIALVSGKDGVNGKDGVGIKGSFIDKNGHLILILTDGNTIDAGVIKAESSTPGKFAVTFDYGTGVTETVYSENYRVNAPEVPVRTNYDFVGWYFEESSLEGNFFSWLFDAYAVTKDMTLYANWIYTGDDDDDPWGAWWENITYDTTSLIFQMTNSSNRQELSSGCERYLAGTSVDNQVIDELIRNRNEYAYEHTKVNVTYNYYPDYNDNYYFSNARNGIVEEIMIGYAHTPDMYCNWMTDLFLCSLKGCFANIYSCYYGDNYFDLTQEAYMTDLMRSMTLSPSQIYVVASDYFIDLVRSFYVVPVNVALFNSVAGHVAPQLKDLNYDGMINIEDFFVEVENGEWTYDRLIEYSSAIYNGTSGMESYNDVLGFALGKNGLPAAGMIYTSNNAIIERIWNNNEATYEYIYPNRNYGLENLFSKISDMMKIDGIMCMDANDAGNLGLTGNEKTALLGIRHKFTNNTLLFGGIITLGSLEYEEYQNMKMYGGFGVVPVPVLNEGDSYLTQIHVTGKAGAIRFNTTKFTQCSAFIQYQTQNSSKVLDHYYKYNLSYGAASGVQGNIKMLQYIRNNVRTSFDRLYEDAIYYYFDIASSLEDSRWHVMLAESEYQLDNFADVYTAYVNYKQACLDKIKNEYPKLPM